MSQYPNADVQTIARGIGLDERIGSRFLDAGLGWGGSCLPKDLKALVRFSKTVNYSPELVEAVITSNENQKVRAVQLAKEALGSLRGKRIAILGLAFKPETDDMREAVSIPVIRGLQAEGAKVIAYDPAAMRNAHAVFEDRITYAQDQADCVTQADCCIIVTEWDEFRAITPETFLRRMRSPILIDGRRAYDRDRFSRMGVRFLAIGLGPTNRSAE
jgi:UDPglucose 6-dehydrogenase